MVTIKRDDFEWKEGLTVGDLIEDLKKRGKYQTAVESTRMMVVINDKIVTREQYSSTVIGKNDVVNLMSVVMGG